MVPHGEVSELVHVSVPAETSALRNEPTDWRYTRSALCSARSKDRHLVPVRGFRHVSNAGTDHCVPTVYDYGD